MDFLMMAVYAIPILAVIAAAGKQGLWSNTVLLINAVTAALLATNFWEPIVRWWGAQAPGGVHVWDFLAIWGLFAIFFSGMRALTDLVSKVRVRFPKALDVGGSYVMALAVGWVITCFMGMTLHMAPLSREFLWGSFEAEKESMFGLSPDRQWLGFMQKESLGAFSRMTPEGNPEGHVFDPTGEFMPRYATRRQILEKQPGIWVPATVGGAK